LQYLQDMADAELPIFFVGDIPHESAYFKDQTQNDKLFSKSLAKLLKSASVKRVAQISDVPKELSKLQIRPAFNSEATDIITTRRDTKDTSNYFVYNRGNNIELMDLQIEGNGNVYQIDPWTGLEQLLGHTDQPLSISLLSGETTLLKVKRNEKPAKAVTATQKLQQTLSLNTWKYHVEDWTENTSTTKPSDTLKTDYEIQTTALTPWRNLPELSNATSGVGYYSTDLNIRDWSPDRQATLNLGSIGQSSSVQVWVNGKKAPVNLYRLSADIGELLHTGQNEIKVEVASTLGNRLIEQGAITAPIWNPDARIDYEDYGLLGPVTLRTE